MKKKNPHRTAIHIYKTENNCEKPMNGITTAARKIQ